jgi:N-terminal domain of toast_rack, DUF2154
MFRRLIVIVVALAIAVMACGYNVNMPQMPTAGPDVTDQISVPVPSGSGTPILSLGFGAGELNLNPGGDGLVSGTATYNIPALKPSVSVNGSVAKITQGNMQGFNGLPKDLHNTWDLKLGNTPMDLQIDAGAYKARYELGGLTLSNLTIKDGASDVRLKFSAPNNTQMGVLRYETGASNVTIEGIANANPSTLIFKCGAGNYTLNFSGQLQRNITGHIEAGLGNVTLVIPQDVAAQVTVSSGMSNVNADSSWQKNDQTYIQAGNGSGPTLNLVVDIGAGNLTLSH